MNAILSLSLALGRAIAARDGKELWQLIRGMAADTMAGYVAAHGNGRDPAALASMDFDVLKAEFRKAAEPVIAQGGTVYEELREKLPVYAD